MEITFDEAKRQRTLLERGLDFADVGALFDGRELSLLDDRYEYPEPRYQTYGLIEDGLVMVAWTPTPTGIRVISMRKCNDRERKRIRPQLG